MKKQLFLVVVAALAMASCSKDESTGINNGNAIDFRAAMQTRASETTTANITNFFVTALCLLYTSTSPRDMRRSRMPSSA